jgi:hypothetical protein
VPEWLTLNVDSRHDILLLALTRNVKWPPHHINAAKLGTSSRLTNFSWASKHKYFAVTCHSFIIASTSKVLITKVKIIQPLMSKIDENFTK